VKIRIWGSAMARAQVLGFQGKELSPTSLLACAKHFAGYGAATAAATTTHPMFPRYCCGTCTSSLSMRR
jgi:beta-glucosidase-like glycosyl hydrolase